MREALSSAQIKVCKYRFKHGNMEILVFLLVCGCLSLRRYLLFVYQTNSIKAFNGESTLSAHNDSRKIIKKEIDIVFGNLFFPFDIIKICCDS